jgi:integrase
MPSSALSVLENWRAELEAAAEVAAESAPMLAPIAGRLRVRAGHHLSSSQIRNVIRTISGRAGVAAPAPHDFRRTYTSGLLAAGVDVFTVSKLLGHASADTTRGYDLRDERAKRDAADLVFFPATL